MKKNTIILLLLFLLFAKPNYAFTFRFEADQKLPLVHVSLAFPLGYSSDPDHEDGITHFMGAMLLRGTKQKPKHQLDLAFDAIGSSILIETKADALLIKGSVLSENIDLFLSLIQEVLTQPAFSEVEIKKLKSETISTLLSTLADDRSVAQRLHYKHFFDGRGYGKFFIGTQSTVASFDQKKIITRYQNIIQHQSLIVVASGDTSSDKIRSWAEKLPIANSTVTTQISEPSPSKFSNHKMKLLVIDKPARTQSWILVSQPGMSATDPRYDAFSIANYAFGGNFRSKLMQEIREKRGWSYGATSALTLAKNPHTWTFSIFPALQYTPEALALALRLASDFEKNGLSEKEYRFAKQSLLNSEAFSYDTPKKRIENALLETVFSLPDGFFKNRRSRLEKISLHEVNEAVKSYLRSNELKITVLTTAKDSLPHLKKTLKLTDDQIKIVSYQEE